MSRAINFDQKAHERVQRQLMLATAASRAVVAPGFFGRIVAWLLADF